MQYLQITCIDVPSRYTLLLLAQVTYNQVVPYELTTWPVSYITIGTKLFKIHYNIDNSQHIVARLYKKLSDCLILYIVHHMACTAGAETNENTSP